MQDRRIGDMIEVEGVATNITRTQRRISLEVLMHRGIIKTFYMKRLLESHKGEQKMIMIVKYSY